MSASGMEVDPEIAEFEKKIAELQAKKLAAIAKGKAEVIGKMKEAIAAYGITASDLGLSSSSSTKATKAKSQGAQWPIKSKTEIVTYKHPKTGALWESDKKGPIPGWIIENFEAGTENTIIVGRKPIAS